MLQIRKTTYRTVEGFTICGTKPNGQRVNVFTETRESAEHIRDKLKRGESLVLEDFMVGEEA